MACSRGAELGASIWEAFRLSHETAFRFVETALRVGEIALQVGVTTSHARVTASHPEFIFARGPRVHTLCWRGLRATCRRPSTCGFKHPDRAKRPFRHSNDLMSLAFCRQGGAQRRSWSCPMWPSAQELCPRCPLRKFPLPITDRCNGVTFTRHLPPTKIAVSLGARGGCGRRRSRATP
jgi:hypothetical protein